MVNVAIFVSGSGTNCENIIKYFKGSETVSVSLVLSNRDSAYALVRSQELGIDTSVLSKVEFNNERILMDVLSRYKIDFIVLAGFLLIVPKFLIEAYPHKIVNIHPALLPKYGGRGMYGLYVHESVRANNEPETGITIHYVSEQCDAGEIIFQAKIPVTPEETVDEIAAGVHSLEQRYYPETIEKVIKRQF